MNCMLCGRFSPVDHGPFSGDDACYCADCWDELDPAQKPAARDKSQLTAFYIGMGIGAMVAAAAMWLMNFFKGGPM